MRHGTLNPVGMALDEKLIVSVCQLIKAIFVGLPWYYYLLFALQSANNMPCLRHSDVHPDFTCYRYAMLAVF
jgi:hypothetical protein